MVTMPALSGVITPVSDPAVAIEVLLLLHAPPVGVPVSVIAVPTQAVPAPLIAGVIFTVIALVTKPVPTVYVIVATPAATPLTMPPGFILATSGLLLLHVPPGVMSFSVVVVPVHTVVLPVIGAIEVVTVIEAYA